MVPEACPLHNRCLHMFKKLPNKNTRVTVDNLYTSTKFLQWAANLPQQVLLAGTCRTSVRYATSPYWVSLGTTSR